MSDAQLALEVARVMKKRVEQDCGELYLVEDLMDHNGDTYPTQTLKWRPDLDGAAAWEVLEWLVKEEEDPEFWVDRDGERPCYVVRLVNGSGTAWIEEGLGVAICRAAAALDGEVVGS